ncbi:MAG: hypothetical protein KBS62_02970 [Oscillospiraceae bacterium]|nr:hypothetical protein [Candidatus Ruminococcus equi]
MADKKENLKDFALSEEMLEKVNGGGEVDIAPTVGQSSQSDSLTGTVTKFPAKK